MAITLLNYFLPPRGQEIMRQIGPFGILLAILVAQPVFGVAMGPVIEFVTFAFGV